MARNPEVDEWFAQEDHPMEDAMQAVRTLTLADPRVSESIEWKTPTYSYEGTIFSFNPAERLVSRLFHRGAEFPSDQPRLEGDGKLARTMRFAGLADVEEQGDARRAAISSWCEWKDDR